MESWIKRFPRGISLQEAAILGVAAAIFSIWLLFLPSELQFVVTVLATLSLAVMNQYIEDEFGSGNILLYTVVFLSAIRFLPGFLATLFLTGLFFLPVTVFYSRKLLVAALLAHAADVVSTFISSQELSEANPFMQIFIRELGFLPALIISKVFLVFLPIAWVCRNIPKEEREVFLKAVFVIGLAMTYRNLLLYIMA